MSTEIVNSMNNSMLASSFPILTGNVNFESLNTALDSLANCSGALSPEEKTYAVTIVNEWERDVISKLRNQADSLKQFVAFFDTPEYNHFSEDELKDMAERTNTVEYYNLYANKVMELTELNYNRPEKPIITCDTTMLEKAQAEKDYELEVAKYNIIMTKAKREVTKALTNWKNKTKDNPEVKSMVNKARSFNKNLNKFTSECKQKSQLAKLNISISNAEVRSTLKEMLNFVIKL